MSSAFVDAAGSAHPGDLLLGVVARRGSAAHPYVGSDALLHGPQAGANLADVTHFLCTVHGRHPGAIDYAAERVAERLPHRWLERALDAFADERAFLARLAAAAGPVPGTPAAADSDVVVMAQCHAIEMLSRSERKGCALGAAIALAVDWGVIRRVLGTAAGRFGVALQPYDLIKPEEVREVIESVAETPGIQRALLFGAEQISMQHHGLWDLLEARKDARGTL